MASDDDFEASLAAKSDQVNNADLSSGPMTINITKIKITNSEQQKWSISFAGSEKFYRPCLGMRRLIAEIWGKPPYSGRSMTIYRDPDVRYGSDIMGGIRISHMSNIDGPKKVTVPVSRGKVKTYHIQPLTIASAPTAPDNALDLCEAAARRGTDAFRAWWGSDEGKACRAVAQANIEALKAMASAADTAPESTDEEPPM